MPQSQAQDEEAEQEHEEAVRGGEHKSRDTRPPTGEGHGRAPWKQNGELPGVDQVGRGAYKRRYPPDVGAVRDSER
eukprot:768262-Hanusia_phi.AAC.1